MKTKMLVKDKIDFPTTEEYPREMIKRVQQELLQMVKIVCSILEKYEIPYFIAYGTLFGAIKFGGFLPWDDDIDLFLFDDSYDKAIQYLEKELPNYLIIHSKRNDPLYFLAWNSVKNINVEVKDSGIYNKDNRLLKYRFLGLDLYRLKKINSNDLMQYKKAEAIKFFERKLKAGIISEDEFKLKKREVTLMYQDKEISQRSTIGTEVFSFIVKQNKPIDPQYIFPLKKYKFEDTELFGPNNPKKVLECSFSNIDELPNYKERKPHLKKVKFKSK